MKASKNTPTEGATPESGNGLEGFESRMLTRALDLQADPEKYEEAMSPVGGNPITLGPRVTDAASWAKDQVEAAKAKSKKWFDNSKRPKKVPSVAALEAKPKYEERLRAALDEDLWGKAMAGVDEDLRMQVIELKGEAGFRGGIDAHKPKVDAKVKKLQPLVLALAQEIDRMPVATDSDREARMLAARRGMLAIGKAMKGA